MLGGTGRVNPSNPPSSTEWGHFWDWVGFKFVTHLLCKLLTVIEHLLVISWPRGELVTRSGCFSAFAQQLQNHR